MKAAVLKQQGVISIEEVETPRAGPGEVVVKVSYCGICGSDLHRFQGDTSDGTIMGHEFSGVISELGAGVTGWSVGQRVTPVPFAPCWRCYECTHGTPHLCRNTAFMGVAPTQPGAYAEYVRVKASQLYATPEDITDQDATLAEPLAVSLHAVLLGRITVGTHVAIIGAGPVGLLAIQCARLAGARGVYVAQRSAPRAALARQMGADAVINPVKEDFRREVRRRTPVGADVSLECVGSNEAFQLAMRCLRPGGRVVVVGLGGPVEIITREFATRELEIKGSIVYWGEFAESLDLLGKHRVKTEGLVTKVIPLSGIPAAYADLLRARDQIKVLVAP